MRKSLSIILAMCLLFAVAPISIFDLNASAATQNEAVSWLRAQDGAWYDLDGAYGAQCSDFASAYMNWLVTGNPYGGVYGVYYAYYYPTVADWDTTKWEVISNYYDFVPQPGDIFVTVGADPSCGHVGVVIASNINTATIIDQNYVNWNLDSGSNAVIHEISWTGSYSPTYFIRFKNFSTASLVTPTISFDKSSYTLGETITISWQASPAGSNLSHYWITISDANGSIIADGGLGGSTTYYNFTPSSVGTYSVKIYATPFGSQYGEGSLTDTKSVTVHSPHTHSYGSWNVRNAATCTANGTDYRACACGAEETRTTTALGHNYTSSVTKPTCTTGGYTTYTCTRCYSSYTANNTSATGHSYGSWNVRNAATCTANGIDYRTCACGAEETRTTTALGHNYTSVTTKPTCTSGGYTTYNCINCGNSYTDNAVSALGHTEGAWVTLWDGSKEQRCTVCDELLGTKPGPAPEPQYSLGDINADGNIDTADYVLVKRAVLHTYTFKESEKVRADVNCDCVVDSFDYILIKRHSFGTFVIR